MRLDGVAVSITLQQGENGDIIDVQVPAKTSETYKEAKRLLENQAENQAQQNANKRVLRFSLHGTEGDVTVDVVASLSKGKKEFKVARKNLDALVEHELVVDAFTRYLPEYWKKWQQNVSLTLENGNTLSRPRQKPSQGSLREFLCIIHESGILTSLNVINEALDEATPVALPERPTSITHFFATR